MVSGTSFTSTPYIPDPCILTMGETVPWVKFWFGAHNASRKTESQLFRVFSSTGCHNWVFRKPSHLSVGQPSLGDRPLTDCSSWPWTDTRIPAVSRFLLQLACWCSHLLSLLSSMAGCATLGKSSPFSGSFDLHLRSGRFGCDPPDLAGLLWGQ